jgi:hypothetical protein
VKVHVILVSLSREEEEDKVGEEGWVGVEAPTDGEGAWPSSVLRAAASEEDEKQSVPRQERVELLGDRLGVV